MVNSTHKQLPKIGRNIRCLNAEGVSWDGAALRGCLSGIFRRRLIKLLPGPVIAYAIKKSS